MSTNPQSQSKFVVGLPREIREAIYLELWRSCGLRQHIIWHTMPDRRESHFCRWRCTTEYRVADNLQQDLEVLRVQLGVSLGQDMSNKLYGRRLMSPWLNHWGCGEHIESWYGYDAYTGFLNSGSCWKKRPDDHYYLPQSPYIPMLLSCKLLSSECLTSIYESTTLIFINTTALQMFFGYCEKPTAVKALPKTGPSPPGFFKYTRHLEFSFLPNFWFLSCATPEIHGDDDVHEVYDFHWLHLDQFRNLRSIKIWIAARAAVSNHSRLRGLTDFNKLSIEALKTALSHFATVDSVIVSTPLSQDTCREPEDGFVEGIGPPGVYLWRRGAGDSVHPFLAQLTPEDPLNALIHTSSVRDVQLGCDGVRIE